MVPGHCLIVFFKNSFSFKDILAFGAMVPCYFVAIIGDDYVVDCIVIGVHLATEG